MIETYISEVTVQEKLEIHIIAMFWFKMLPDYRPVSENADLDVNQL